MNNQECKVKPEIVNVNSNEPLFYPFSLETSKCSGSCNNTNDPYAKLCVPDVVKNLDIKSFNLMSRTNETSHIKRHEKCKCKCRPDANVCNNKQRWNEDKYMCECKEWIDEGVCDKGFIWNPSNCERECDKSCDIAEYLGYSNCKCRKKLIDKLVEECIKSTDEVEIASKNEEKINAILAHCTLYCFQYYLQSVSGLLLILFTVNTWVIIKKRFLNMILSIKQKIINIRLNWRSQRNKHKKSNILFGWHDRNKKFSFKLIKNR